MNYSQATKTQLLQITLHETCSLDDKYQASRELQLRFIREKYGLSMTEEKKAHIIYQWTKGASVKELCDQVHVSTREVAKLIDQYKLWRGRLLG